MWFCVRKTSRWGPAVQLARMVPNPQDACALPRKNFMGRPKVSNLRDMQLKLNLTATEYECVVRRANAAGMRPVHYSRTLVLNTSSARTPSQQIPDNIERLHYLALSRIGNNLNQMMRHLHRTGEPTPSDLEPLLVEIREIINRTIKKWI